MSDSNVDRSRAPGVAWRPGPEQLERSRIARFLRAHGLASLDALRRRALEDPEWFWRAVSADIGMRWLVPFERVLDASRGIRWPSWFPGGRLNFADSCVDRHVDAGRGEAIALIGERDDAAPTAWTFRALQRDVARLGGALRRLGVGEGDRVGLYLPMSPEAAIAVLAAARIGAVVCPCFSGFGAQAVASRLADCEARVLITGDAFRRRDQLVPQKRTADEALRACPSVERVIVARRTGAEVPWDARRDVWWDEAVAAAPEAPPAPVAADHPLFIVYTSGTTGRPKGAVLTQGGFLVKGASDFAYLFDVGPDDRLFWLTDPGWVMGPLAIASLLHGGAVVCFEGTPDFPGPDRLWSLVERHRVSVMGLSPTAVRALLPHGTAPVAAHDLSSLRILGGTGEPWNPEPWRFYFEQVGKSRLPVINYTGGTEISGGILGCFPIEAIKPCSFSGPIPGIAAEVLDDAGRPVREAVGELAITRPWPGMTAGFWRDPARYEETYWSRFPGMWVHGDWAQIDADGFWFLQGRSDDTLKIAGKRLGPAEVESVLVEHPAVVEAGVVGVPHEVKGEAIVCFAVLRPGHSPSESLRAELAARVADRLGKALRPERVLFARELPKTRSAKIMRRVIRAAHLRRDPGDVSSLENPSAVAAIAEAS
jgi:acetyl-CoA synthetase